MSEVALNKDFFNMFTFYDAFVIISLLVSASLGISRGFTREIGATFAAIAGVAFGVIVVPKIVALIDVELSWKINLAIVVASSFIVMTSIIVIAGNITELLWLRKWFRNFDRFTGLIFGCVRGYALVGLVYLFFVYSHGNNIPGWINNASFLPVGTSSAKFIEPFIPEPKTLEQ